MENKAWSGARKHFSSRGLAERLSPQPCHPPGWLGLLTYFTACSQVAAGFLCVSVCLCFKSLRKEYFSTREMVRMQLLAWAGVPLTTQLPGAAPAGVVSWGWWEEVGVFPLGPKVGALLLAPCWGRKAATDPTSGVGGWYRVGSSGF